MRNDDNTKLLIPHLGDFGATQHEFNRDWSVHRSNSYIPMPDHSDWDFGIGDFKSITSVTWFGFDSYDYLPWYQKIIYNLTESFGFIWFPNDSVSPMGWEITRDK